MTTDAEFKELVACTWALGRHAEQLEQVIDTLRLILLTHMRQCLRDHQEMAFFLPTEARKTLERDSVFSKATILGDHKDDLSGI